jgi:hypothetical protein
MPETGEPYPVTSPSLRVLLVGQKIGGYQRLIEEPCSKLRSKRNVDVIEKATKAVTGLFRQAADFLRG